MNTQKQLNKNGITDRLGKQLVVDGKLGPKTDGAVNEHLGKKHYPREINNKPLFEPYPYYPGETKPEISKPVWRGKPEDIEVNLLSGKNTPIGKSASGASMPWGISPNGPTFNPQNKWDAIRDIEQITENTQMEKFAAKVPSFMMEKDDSLLKEAPGSKDRTGLKKDVEETNNNNGLKQEIFGAKNTESPGKLLSIDNQDVDPEVRMIQLVLIDNNYTGKNGEPLEPDGIFGENTKYAVEKFQKDHGLSCDGIVGPETRKAMNLSEHPDITKEHFNTMARTVYEHITPESISADGDFFLRLYEFCQMVRKGSALDLKDQPEWESSYYIFNNEVVRHDATGNIAYGMAGRLLGIHKDLLLKAAGVAQIVDNKKIELGFAKSNFDDPIDQYNIILGYLYADSLLQ